jgi:hypothetical protein
MNSKHVLAWANSNANYLDKKYKLIFTLIKTKVEKVMCEPTETQVKELVGFINWTCEELIKTSDSVKNTNDIDTMRDNYQNVLTSIINESKEGWHEWDNVKLVNS